jgi:hypothetical protein
MHKARVGGGLFSLILPAISDLALSDLHLLGLLKKALRGSRIEDDELINSSRYPAKT